MNRSKRFHLWGGRLGGALLTLGLSSWGSAGIARPDPDPGAAGDGACTIAHASKTRPAGPECARVTSVLPLAFEEGGVRNSGVFHARGPGYGLTLDRGKATLHLPAKSARERSPGRAAWSRLEIRLLGANRSKGVGTDPLRAHASHFSGKDPSRWRSEVPLYASVRFERVYDGVDLRYYGSAGSIEHDFELAPGADPAKIRLALKGADSVSVSAGGDLRLAIDASEVVLHRPVAYQATAGARREIDAAYELRPDRTVGFRLGDYDRGAPLVIDPIITYSTYLGGPGNADNATSVAYDDAGFAYVLGTTSDFPVTAGVFDTSAGGTDAFIAKLDPRQSGNASLVWATYLGGEAGETTGDITVDAASNVYVVLTVQDGFPTTAGAFDTVFNGSTDVGVSKLNSSGTALLWSTFLGGGEDESGVSVGVELSGAVAAVGPTTSSNFPTTSSAYDRTLASAPDGYLSLLSPDGSHLLYSTLLGGNGLDSITSVAFDGQGRAYVSGVTWSTDFPTTAGAFDRTLGGTTDGFVARFDPSLSGTASLGWATLLGGSLSFEAASSIVLAPGDEPVVMGYTNSNDMPGTSMGFDTVVGGSVDMFVVRLTNDGSSLTYGTYIGGSSSESFSAQSLAVDDFGRAHVAGGTSSADYPATAGSIDTCAAGQIVYTVVDTNVTGASSLVESGCAGLGGAVAMAIDACGNSALTGFTTSAVYPVINGYDATLGGTRDAILMQIHSTGGAPRISR